MKKTGVKTFVYSFVFSLLAIFLANGVCFRANHSGTESLKIPQKNVSLFFKSNFEAASARSNPIKRIELTTLIPKEEANTSPIEDDHIPLEIATIQDDIPLEVTSLEKELQPPLAPEAIAEAPKAEEQTMLPEPQITQESPEPIVNKVIEAKTEIKVVRNDLDKKEETASLIPLEKGVVEGRGENIVIVSNEKEQNKLAMTPKDTLAKDIKNTEFIDEEDTINSAPEKWEKMSEKPVIKKEDSPWVVAKGAKYPKNNLVLEESFAKDMNEAEIKAVLSGGERNAEPENGVKLASEMVQNILIPIPEEIMKDENLTPQLISPDKESNEKSASKEMEEEINADNEEDRKSILKSLGSIFAGSKTEAEKQVGAAKQPPKDGGFFDQLTKKVKGDKAPVKILPTEMRLSFQPNRAEISGQTLKWIHAFAKKTKEEDDVIMEVRIDGSSSFELQQKRLNLLQNILRSKEVDPHKVNIVFTTREPNSFIVRTLRVSSDLGSNTQRRKSPNTNASYY